MSSRPISQAVIAVLLAGALTACGDGDGEDLVEEGSLRDCLAGAGLKVEAPDVAAGARLGNVSPDFRAITTEGDGLDVIVHGTEQKARRSAADIRGALATFGAAGSEVVARRNAVVVFEQAPSGGSSEAVESCLEDSGR